MRRSLYIVMIVGVLTGCEAYTTSPVERDAVSLKMRSYGCTSCHIIPGIAGADSVVGPPLSHMGNRATIAGVIPNTPENLAHWIQHPQQIHSGSAMPEMFVTPQDAKAIALYLETLH